MSNFAIHPLGKKILVRRDAPDEHYEGTGIIKPEVAQRAKNLATIVAFGDRVYEGLTCDQLKEGDHVLLTPYGAQDLPEELFGPRLVLVELEDIAGLVEDVIILGYREPDENSEEEFVQNPT